MTVRVLTSAHRECMDGNVMRDGSGTSGRGGAMERALAALSRAVADLTDLFNAKGKGTQATPAIETMFVESANAATVQVANASRCIQPLPDEVTSDANVPDWSTGDEDFRGKKQTAATFDAKKAH
ncbi:hypothetical protein Pelo_18100 [Pelomyxa schiedti]|nr:hypothetical protein Pelo_18100 [Pelomyxa schiedti]